MDLIHQQQWKPQLLPAEQPVQNTGPGTSGYPHRPQNTSHVEVQMAGQAHQNIQARLKMANSFQQYRAQIISNKYAVTVTSEPASVEDRICLTVYEKKTAVLFTVTNPSAQTVYLSFWASDLVKNIFTVRDSHGNRFKTINKHVLGPGEEYKIRVDFYSDYAGFYEQLLVFKFETDQPLSEKFKIMRLLEVIYRKSRSEEFLLTKTDPLCDLQTVRQSPASSTLLRQYQPAVPLKKYPMTNNIKDVIKSDRNLQRSPLKRKNYSWRFHLLLHLEEFCLTTEIEKFNLDDVPMFRHQGNTDCLIVQVADVSKDSSNVLNGHHVQVTPLDQSGVFDNRFYRGWIHHVDAENVYLNFNRMFLSQFQDGMRFSVNFKINRNPLQMQHRAVAQVHRHRLKHVLFPAGQRYSHCSHLHRLLELENNPEQCMAIQHIVARSAKPAPYLVFGPPGTGKTVTLVDAMKQIMKTQDSDYILACAPSNSATDHLCKKILEGNIDKSKVYRLYALTFPVRNIPENIKSCCNLNQDTGTLMIPSKEELMNYKIVVTTLLTAGRLVTEGIPRGHYTYVFVDEAGQATEPECIIPIAGLVKPRGCQVVLAGDPKQLGPIIKSTITAKHGMGVSLLERLMRHINVYKPRETNGFNSCFVTKLLRNYRSHPAILEIPNELFYNGELQAHAFIQNCNSYCTWERLPKKGVPLIFHGVAGTHEQDIYSHSVYNIAEAEVLTEYLKSLIDYHHKKGKSKIEPGEIGIIAPYNKQLEKIQIAIQMDKDLRKENLENVLVGSVEQFQSREFNVIMVSVVRSNPKLSAPEQQFTLGFVNNEKRFNVAMTRAKALLIVVGDPRILKADPTWNKFIHYCYKEGAYCGITVFDTEEEKDTSEQSLTF